MKLKRRLICMVLSIAAVVVLHVSAFAATQESIPDSSAEDSIPAVYRLDEEPEMQTEALPPENAEKAPAKQSDAPLFAGAGIAVMLFGGVVVFCRMKGNR